ncbi:hypothetical protein Bbelb_301700 [Branchiostoma belcheri]|nr:hypothetical protein Bbelb_301700 [Branchiostoma belcheri]
MLSVKQSVHSPGEGGVLVDPPPPTEWQPGLKMGNTPSGPEGTGKGDQAVSQDSDSGTDLGEDAANSPDEEKISDDSASVSVATAEESSPPGPTKLESSEPPPGPADTDSHETTSAVRTTPDGSDQTETESPSPEAPEKDSTTPGDTSTPDPPDTAADEPEAVTVEDEVEFSEVVEKKAEDKAPAATTEETTTDPQTATDAAEESSASAPSTTTSTASMSTEARTASYFQAAGMDPGMVQLLKQMYPDIFVQMEAYTRLVTHVNTLGFSFRSHVPMDGNCMFHAVADQLRRTDGPEMSHQELRSKAVDYLRKHPFTEGKQHLRSFVPDEKWDSYLAAMSRDGEWGDHIALIALASVLRREIHVVSSTPGDDFLTKVHPNGGSDEPVTGPPLLLGHYAEQHYVSLDGPQRPRRQLSRQLSIEAPPPRDLQDKPEGMTFHAVCGPTVMLSPNKRSAHRLSVPDEQTSTSALVFSAAPVQVDQEVQIEFSGYTDKGSGALYFGVTTLDPATWSPAELPASLAVDERNIAGFWVWPIDHDLMTTGALFKFSVNCNGNLEYSSNVNGGRSKLQLASIPADQPIWAVLDLQGRTQTVKFVDGEDKKKATVIWKKGEGPDFPPDINVVMGFLQNLLMDKIQILKSCAAVIREEETPERARRALTYLRKLTMKVIETGDEEENRKVYIGNREFKETILRAHSAQQFMVAAGWCQVDDMMVFTRTCDVLLQPTVEALDESLSALPEESFTENDTAEEMQPAEEKNALQDKIQIISTCAAIIKEQERTKLAREALNTVRRMTNNILKQPDDQKYRKVRVGNKTFQETVMKSTNAQQFVVAAGWKQVEEVMVFDKTNDELLSPTLQIIDDLLSSLPWETPDDNDETAHPFVPQSTAEAAPVGSPKLVKGLPTGVKATRDARFHVIRGSNIALSPDRKSARRKGGISNAITFSDKPFGTGQMIAVQITDRDPTVECAVVLGVTTVDPIKWDTEQLPQFLSDLSNEDGFWSEPVGDDAALPGNILTLYVSGSGSMKCSVYATGADQPVEEFDVVCNIPTGKPMWAVLDLFGSTTAEKQDSDEETPLVTETDRSYVASLLSNISENIPSTTDKEEESKEGNEAGDDSSPTRTSGPAEEEIKDAEASAHATGETVAAEAGMSTEDLPRENWLTPFVNELLEKETVEQAKLTLTTLWTITDQVSNQKASDDNTRKLTTNDIPFAEAIKASSTTYQLFQKAGWKTLGDMLVFPQFGGHGPILVALEEGLCNLDKDETPAPEEKTDTSEGPHGTVKLTIKTCIEEIEGKETTGQARITLSAIRDVARRVRDNPGDNKYRKIDMRERAYADAIRRSEAAKNFMVTAGWIQVGDKLIFPKYCDKRLDRILTPVEESLSKLPDFHLAPEDGETAKEKKEPKETKSPPEEKETVEEKITEGKIAPEMKKHPEEETPVAAPGSNARAPVKTVNITHFAMGRAPTFSPHHTTSSPRLPTRPPSIRTSFQHQGHHPVEVGAKRQRLAFCSVHGSALQLRDGGKTMRRLYATDDDTSAITFSNRPIDIGEKITVEISEYRSRYSEDGRGVVILGLTTEDPSTLSQIDLPACVIDLTAQKNYWARRIKGKYIGSGDTLTFYLDQDGNLTYSLKDVEDEVHLCDIPTDKPLWTILDMDGGATTLTFKDDLPEEKGFRMPWEGWSIDPDITTSPAVETDKLRDGTPQTTEQNTEEEATPARSPAFPSEPDVDADAMTEEEKLAFAFQKFKEQVKDPAKEQPPEELIQLINAIRQRSEGGDDSSDSEDEDDEFNLSSELLGKLGSAFFETIMRSELQHLFGQSTSTSEETPTSSGAGEPRQGLAETKASLEDRVQIVKACIETMEEEAGTERAIMSLTLIRQIISNILDSPGDPKYRQIRMKNKSVSGDILDVPTAVQLLAAIGWVQSDNSFVLPSSSDDLLEPTLKAVDGSLRVKKHLLKLLKRHIQKQSKKLKQLSTLTRHTKRQRPGVLKI